METAASLIKDILQECLIQADEQAAQSVDFNTALRYTNRYMAQLDAEGIKLGWTVLDNANSPVTVPDGAINGIIYNVAMKLCSSYDIEITAALAMNASDSMTAMENLGVQVPNSLYSNTLPIGSGNEGDGTFNWRYYVNCDQDTQGDQNCEDE